MIPPTSYFTSSGFAFVSRKQATARANGDGTIAKIINGGSGYVAPPTITFSGTNKCTVFPK